MFGFFAALLAGVLLAFAFQLTLTQLSFAAGVSALGDLKKKVRRHGEHEDAHHREGVHHREVRPGEGHRPPSETERGSWKGVNAEPHRVEQVTNERPGERGHLPGHREPGRPIGADAQRDASLHARHDEGRHDGWPEGRHAGHHHGDEHDHPVGAAARKALSGAGLWALLTSSLALFFASWLAVELTTTISLLAGAVVGLAVWATFYLVVTTWEAAAFSSLAGSVTRVAVEGSRAVLGGVGSIFRPSPEKKMVDTARDIAGAVRDELTAGLDAATLERKIDHWVRELEPTRLEASDVRKQVLALLKDVEIHTEHEPGEAPNEEELVLRFQKRGFELEDARRAAGGVREAWNAAKTSWRSGRKVDAAVAAAAKVAGWSPEDAAAFRGRVEGVLRESHRKELEPDALVRDLEVLFTAPSEGVDRLRDRLSAVDAETVVSLLRQREGMDDTKARALVERVQHLFERLTGMVGRTVSGTSLHRPHGAPAPMVAHADADGVWTEVIDRWAETHRVPGPGDEGIRRDLRLLLEDPSAGADRLLTRLRGLRREDLRRIVAAAPGVDEARADQILGWIEHTRDDVIDRVERATEEAKLRALDARDLAVEEAEEIRKTAAVAAWWAFVAAAVSGTAAALGGVVAVAS